MSDVDGGVSIFALEVIYASFFLLFSCYQYFVSGRPIHIIFMPHHIMTYCNGLAPPPLHILTLNYPHRNIIITI